jgi:hypothetical protein
VPKFGRISAIFACRIKRLAPDSPPDKALASVGDPGYHWRRLPFRDEAIQ